MRPHETNHGRGDPRELLRRDAARRARRERGHRSFWRSLQLMGAVGWPIALAAVGGTALGRYLDVAWGAGVRYTLMLMTAGIIIGCAVAWRAVTRGHD